MKFHRTKDLIHGYQICMPCVRNCKENRGACALILFSKLFSSVVSRKEMFFSLVFFSSLSGDWHMAYICMYKARVVPM